MDVLLLLSPQSIFRDITSLMNHSREKQRATVALTPRQDAIVMQPIVALAAKISRIAGALCSSPKFQAEDALNMKNVLEIFTEQLLRYSLGCAARWSSEYSRSPRGTLLSSDTCIFLSTDFLQRTFPPVDRRCSLRQFSEETPSEYAASAEKASRITARRQGKRTDNIGEITESITGANKSTEEENEREGMV